MSERGCREYKELLLGFSGGGLDDESRANLERHMDECPGCREVGAGQRAVWDALDAWEAAPISPGFDSRLYGRIERETSLWGRMTGWVRPSMRRGAPIAAAAGLALVAGMIALNPTAAPPQPLVMQVELWPDQADSVLEEMEYLRELNSLLRPDSPEPTL